MNSAAGNMTICEVDQGSHRHLQEVADILAAGKKIVVLVGAGISTDCGIPVLSHLTSVPDAYLKQMYCTIS